MTRFPKPGHAILAASSGFQCVGPVAAPAAHRGNLRWIRRAAVASFVALALAGCGPKENATNVPQAGTVAPVVQESEERCLDMLESVMGMLRLEELGESADLDQCISLLTQWQRLCEGRSGGEFEMSPREIGQLQKLLPEDQVAKLRRIIYETRDGEHLRNCLLFRAVQEHAIQDGDSDLTRIVNLFEHTIRNIHLLDQRPDDTPFTPYEIYLIGQGTPRDRAWFFAGLLQQLQIDAVILEPQEPVSEPGPVVVGVLLGGKIYLFDCWLGLPFPTSEESGIVGTLAEWQANPDLAKNWALDDEHPYPLSAETLRDPKVLLVGNTSYWSPRMDQLQDSFSGVRAAAIYGNLIDSRDRSGQVSRVAEGGAGRWEPAAIAVWTYPEAQLSGYENMNSQQSQTLEKLTDAWKAPIIPRVEPTQVTFEPGNQQLKARMTQLMGDYENAIKTYTSVRLRCLLPKGVRVDPRLRRIHEKATEDATFWMGVCKLEQGSDSDVKVAQDKFRQYLKDYPEGTWSHTARGLLADVLAADGNTTEAAAVLQESSDTAPQHWRNVIRLRSWETPATP